jgi:Ser/Thr protein kinase RdoA (MazF antagonist)
MPETDPLAVIAEVQPDVSEARARRAVREQYGLEASLRPLVSERDQNFLLQTADGPRYVLKIANAAEDPVVTDFQIEALLHIEHAVEEGSIPVAAPRVLLTRDGSTHFILETESGRHIARVVSFIDGVPLGERIPSPALARDMGSFLAHLGRALADFSHPGSGHSLLWDMQHALRLRPLIVHVPEVETADAVSAALDDFERFAAPELASLRRQVIHSDFNADNVVIESADPDKVAGVIDFGDMLEAPLVADVAIGASYVRTKTGDPLSLMAEFVAAYHRVTPLTRVEVDILFELIQARLSASVVILDWRASMRGDDDPYLQKMVNDEASARNVLCRLRELPRENARRTFREVCASVACS